MMLMAVETFGGALKRIRESRKLSGARLARTAGLDASYVSRLEFGSREPSRIAVLQLAAALECRATETDTLLMAAGFLPFGNGLHPDLLALNEALADDGLPEAYRASVLATVAALVQGCAAVRTERRQAA